MQLIRTSRIETRFQRSLLNLNVLFSVQGHALLGETPVLPSSAMYTNPQYPYVMCYGNTAAAINCGLASLTRQQH